MARLTVEDCLHELNNRFELILCAAKRAQDLERGAEALVPWDNDKPTVVALREIAEGLINQEGKPIEPIQFEATETAIVENVSPIGTEKFLEDDDEFEMVEEEFVGDENVSEFEDDQSE